MTNKEYAICIFNKHIQLAMNATDGGKLFRTTVIQELMATCKLSLGAASTYYNSAKLTSPKIEGLGRQKKLIEHNNVVQPTTIKDTPSDVDDCFTVIELLKHKNVSYRTVGRTVSFARQGEASEFFDERTGYKPKSIWVMIQGMGPMHTEPYILEPNETELKRYSPDHEVIVEKELIFND